MSQPLTLLVLAAGMGSRYGGLKQMDPMGPNGETVLDYSVYDAIRAGFNRVCFIIREDFADGLNAREPVAPQVERVFAQHFRGTDDGLVLACKYLGLP